MGDTNLNNWRPFVYGGLASIVAELGKYFSYKSYPNLFYQYYLKILGTFPLDTTKTRLQVQGQKYDKRFSSLRYSGMIDALVQIPKQEGYKALYSGCVVKFNKI